MYRVVVLSYGAEILEAYGETRAAAKANAFEQYEADGMSNWYPSASLQFEFHRED